MRACTSISFRRTQRRGKHTCCALSLRCLAVPLKIGFAGALERCRDYLRAELAEGPKLRLELEKAAKAQGYHPVNLHAAARTMGIVSDRVRVHGVGWRARWSLPPENSEGKRAVNPPPEPSTKIATADDSPTRLAAQLQTIQQQNRLVDIYRRVDGELGFVDSMPGTECTLRQIKRRFGGGRYNIEGAEFVIEGSPLSPEGEQKAMRPLGSKIVSDGPASSSGGFDTSALLMTLIKQQGDILVALLTKGNPSATDPVAMFNAVDQAVTRRLEAGTASSTPVEQALALLREGMTLGQNVAEGREPGEDDGFNRMVQAVAPFLNMLATRLAPSAQPAPAELPAPAGPHLVREGGPVTAIDRVMTDLVPTLPELLENARKGVDPATVAEWIHEHASEEQYDALAEAADSPQFVTELLEALAPQIVSRKAGWASPWLETAVKRLHELLVEDSRDDGAAGGNADGAAAAGPAGAGRGAPPHRPG